MPAATHPSHKGGTYGVTASRVRPAPTPPFYFAHPAPANTQQVFVLPKFGPNSGYYDALFTLPDERELLLGDLRIYRLEGGAWRPVPTYLPSGYPFAVAPLNEQTGGALIAAAAEGPRVEYYRIFWTPRVP